MSIICLSNLTFSYDGSDNIFEDVNLNLDTDWRLGLVGRNGRGKTTLLKILMGELEYSGSISSNAKFDYFPYVPHDSAGFTMDVLREVSGAEDWQINREMNLMEISEDVLWREFTTLSHGERTKALLCAMFLREGSFLLIDEPTNHLDLLSRQKLGEYLRSKSGFILVSHDRSLLDACTDHTLSINRADIELQQGSFSTWWDGRQQQDESERAENDRLRKDIKRLTDAAKQASQFSSGAESEKYATRNSGLRPDRGYLGHKSAKLMQRKKNLDRRREREIDDKSSLLKNAETAWDLKLSPLIYRSERLVELKDVAVSYDGYPVCDNISFEIKSGDRLILRGKNGCGKSSILRIIAGESVPHSGQVSVGSQLKISYLPQSTEHLTGTVREFADECAPDVSIYFSVLDKLGIPRTQFDMPISGFSAGQKKKLLLAASLCESAHLYLWDEPLNYIDLLSRMQLEKLIEEFCPTMLIVEHDASFCDAIGTGVIEM